MSEGKSQSPTPSGAGRFATTHWTVIRSAINPSSPEYKQALVTLCQTYWFPLYAYVRRNGYDTHEAQDYTQAFFTQILEKCGLGKVDSSLGKFRSYLLGALKHFMADERDRLRAKKRGGDQTIISLDIQNAEDQYAREPIDRLSPEKLFERTWALTVLQKAMSRLEGEFHDVQKQRLFRHLINYLAPTGDSVPYSDMADKLHMSEGAVKVSVHRMRKRYQELLRDEIAQTVASEEEIEEELCGLFDALSS